MFPISDDNSDRTTWPVVNYTIIGLNVLVFLLLQQLGSNEHFTYAFSLVPKEVATGIDLVGPQVISDGIEDEPIDLTSWQTPCCFLGCTGRKPGLIIMITPRTLARVRRRHHSS